MGASFQAPRATPGQRPMEMHHGEHLNRHCFPFVPKLANMSADMLDGLGIGCWDFLQYLTQNGPNTASYSNVIPIDTSRLCSLLKKNVYIKIKFGIKSINSMTL